MPVHLFRICETRTKWPGAIRVRPPMGKDWGQARRAGLDLRGFWGGMLQSYLEI